jgi:hypothetical protein
MGFKSDIATASQDVSVRSGYGAYTGELSAQLLVDSGITWALTGHSERRDGFNAPVCVNSLSLLDSFHCLASHRRARPMNLLDKRQRVLLMAE